jgi:CheY-like chemotaxis protein
MCQKQGETILLVEDEPLVLKITEAMLKRLGYQVLVANNGREALDIYAGHQENIALVLTDLTMPDLGGVALALGHETIDLSTPGIVEWAQKPFSMERLDKILSQWL